MNHSNIKTSIIRMINTISINIVKINKKFEGRYQIIGKLLNKNKYNLAKAMKYLQHPTSISMYKRNIKNFKYRM